MNAFDLVSYAGRLIMNGVNLSKSMFKLTYMFYRVINTWDKPLFHGKKKTSSEVLLFAMTNNLL